MKLLSEEDIARVSGSRFTMFSADGGPGYCILDVPRTGIPEPDYLYLDNIMALYSNAYLSDAQFVTLASKSKSYNQYLRNLINMSSQCF